MKHNKNRLKLVFNKFLSMWFVMILLLFCTGIFPGTAQYKIYINTDLEGISGTFKFDQVWVKDTPLNIEANEYFMGDVAAVVRGLRDAGVTEIVVLDGHGQQAVIPHLMEPGAKYITGKPRPGVSTGLDESFDGIIFLGFHAMRGTPDGVLNHAQGVESRFWYNGVESGELAQNAAIAGYYGVPPIMVTGDVAACREARQFFGEHCVTVAVKQGLAREAAILYPFEETRKALYEGAKQAIAAIPKCKPYIIETPIKAKKIYLDPSPSTIEYLSKYRIPDYWESKLVTKEGIIEDVLHITDF
ncbi:M55 family metallopeptidase [Bacteroidota bacterium]